MSNYFGSDLNKFINENCRKDMTVNNIDLVQLRKGVEYASYRTVIRFIESKHIHEKTMSDSQKYIHKILAEALLLAQSKSIVQYEHYIVKGSEPYDDTRVFSVLTRQTYSLDRNELIRFLDFDLLLK